MKNKFYLLLFILTLIFFIYEGVTVIKNVSLKKSTKKNVFALPKAIELNNELDENDYKIKIDPFNCPEKLIKDQKITEIPPFEYTLIAITNEGDRFSAMVRNNKTNISLIIKKADVLGKWKVEEIKKNKIIVSYNGIKKRISIW